MQIIHDAATKLQAAVRKCIVRKQFMRLRWAVILSQARLRMSQARKTFLAKKSASVTIQRPCATLPRLQRLPAPFGND